MIRKMQTKAQTLDEPTLAMVKLAMTGAMMALVFMAATVLLYVAPAHAHGPSPALTPAPTHEPLTVWTDTLPDHFQVQAADVGLDIVGMESLGMMPMPFYVVTIRSANSLPPAIAFQVLNGTFPTVGFERIDDGQANIELVEY